MIGSIGGTVINIILDPILITTVGWGARGAAIATIVGYLCSDLYFLWLLHKRAAACLSSCPSATSRAGSRSRFWAWVLLPR